MDFLKSCTTNVRVVDNLAAISCEVYTLEAGGDEAARNSELYQTIAKLREGNILCTLHELRLCIFGYKLDPISASLRELGYHQAEVTEDQRRVLLLEAVEASLAYKLAAGGLTHIAPWTWLFSDNDAQFGSGYGSILIELHAKLGSNGALFVFITIRESGLLPAVPDPKRVQDFDCLLAPSGKFAKACVQSSEDGRPTVSSAAWKASVTEILGAEGISIIDEEGWTEVEFDLDGDATRFLWPSKLCLRTDDARNAHPLANEERWRTWFNPPIANGDALRDPLAAAEEWFTGAGLREATTRRDEATEMEDSVPTALPDATSDLVTSPPFNQRIADQQAAMGGIYPTPPDGLLPGTQGTQQLPTSDGSTMPPINESSELLPGEEMDGLRHSMSSSNAPEGGFHRSDDDLFGDMGEMDFGGNEVGDADFDYFDEPDDEPDAGSDGHDAINDVEMADDGVAHQAEEAEQAARDLATEQEPRDRPEMELDGDLQPTGTQGVGDINQTPADGDPAALSDQPHPPNEAASKPERPLSPFGIRERLLPPPIPASTVRAENEKGGAQRRASAFGPVIFNEGLGLASKYSSDSLMGMAKASRPQKQEADITLPPKQKKSRAKVSSPGADSVDSDDDSKSSEEDSYESETSVSDAELPHKLPWESRKRKRAMMGGVGEADGEQAFDWMSGYANANGESDEVSAEKVHALTTILLRSDGRGESVQANGTAAKGELMKIGVHDAQNFNDDDLLPVDQLFEELEALDLVYIAQLVSEQSVSVVPHLVHSLKLHDDPLAIDAISSAIQPLFEQALNGFLPAASTCDLTKLALPREPSRQMPSNSGKGPHPVQRTLQRSDSVQQGPDCCPIPPPYIRVQRYGDTVEMLPPALHFWSTLGLSPATGTKDVRVVSVVPGNLDLVHSVQDFINELRLVYEANKLGSWKPLAGLKIEDSDELTMHDDSTVLVQPQASSEEDIDSADILQAYALACEYLGKALAHIGHEEPDRAILVCIVNPFSSSRAQQALCACFWMLYKTYRDNGPKAQRTAQRSDIVLRILPCELLASSDGLVILEQQQFAQLAMEVYDRCPPSSKAAISKDVPAALMPYFAAPAVELAMPVPRRIPFQLAADPPGDLLHENSVLHLAYAISGDRQWMGFSWIDGSGRYSHQLSSCLRGKSIADVIGEAWERTGEWLRARDVTWRVYVVGCAGTADGAEGEKSVRDCWRTVVARKARRQPLHISLLEVDLEPDLQLMPPAPPPQQVSAAGVGEKVGQGFLTPVTTPSGTSMTVSPDASAAAPPTPAPSDPTPDSDADAHLVDIADESWGLMLSAAFATPSTATSTSSSQSQLPLASGMLFRRGSTPSTSFHDTPPLEALTLSLHWDIRLRPNGTVDEGPARQAEFTLREVLRLYRNLALLGRARGLGGGGGRSVVPVHVEGVLRGVRGVEGMMG